MTERSKARAARLANVINTDGTVQAMHPHLLNETDDLETDFLAALTVDSVGKGLQALRYEAGLSGVEVSTKRGLSKGRLSQLESDSSNPQLSSIYEQANALDYDMTIVFTPRKKGKREVRVDID